MRFLLDTSVYSQPLRRNPLRVPLHRWQNTGDRRCAISRVTQAEIEWGLHYEGSERRWTSYRQVMEGTLTVLPVDDSVWSAFSRMQAVQTRLGQPVGTLDLLIAATARVHDLTVATLNARDFSRIEGIRWEDWSVTSL